MAIAHDNSSTCPDVQARPQVASDLFHTRARSAFSTDSSHMDDFQSRTSTSSTSRKRSRIEGSEAENETPLFGRHWDWTKVGASSSSSISKFRDVTSPPALANTEYRTAGGGLDTTTQAASRHDVDQSDSLEDNFRTTWAVRGDVQDAKDVTALGKNRRRRSGLGVEELGSFVANVVGMLWNFCRDKAFQGFEAGGGAICHFGSASPRLAGGRSCRAEEHISIPGQFPDEPTVSEFANHADPNIDTRPAKRIQTSQGNGWVMVNHRDTFRSSTRHASPTFMTSSASPTQKPFLPRSVDARASTRKRVRPSTARLSSKAYTGSPLLGNKRTAPFTSPRSSIGTFATDQQTPTSAEVQRYAAKKLREERQNDSSMRKLNQQLKAMIQEGKAALLTKVEVDEEGELDSGFDEDD